MFIRTPEDLPLYILLIVGSAFVGNGIMWFYLKRVYNKKGFCEATSEDAFSSEGGITLFIPQIMNYVYAFIGSFYAEVDNE